MGRGRSLSCPFPGVKAAGISIDFRPDLFKLGGLCRGPSCCVRLGWRWPPAAWARRRRRGRSAGAVLDRYCLTCHNARLKTGGLVLDSAGISRAGDAPETWEKVARKLRTREMPPPGVPRPDDAAYRSLIATLETTLDAAAEAAPNPGRVPVHRLNRTEYTNAVRDLLALEVDGRSLIADEPDSHGFDNVASVLTVSPRCSKATCRPRPRYRGWRWAIRR